MLKKIAKTVVSGLVLTSAAGAAEVYSNGGNTLNTNVKFQGYFIHDTLGSESKDSQQNSVRRVAPVEMMAAVDFDNYFTHKIDDQTSITTVVKINIAPAGYQNGGMWANSAVDDRDLNDNNTKKIYLDKSYLELVSKYGTVDLGNIEGSYNNITSYADVDIFIGTPAVNLLAQSFFGQDHVNAIKYSNTWNGVTFSETVSVGHDRNAFAFDNIEAQEGNVLKRNFGSGTSVEVDITDSIKAGMAYQLNEYKVFTSYPHDIRNKNKEDMSHDVIGGVQYHQGLSYMGVSGHYGELNWNNRISKTANSALIQGASYTKYKGTYYGLEAGAVYDLSGKGLGFRPSIQFDYYVKKLRKTPYTQSAQVRKFSVQAMEVGISYYFTKNFSVLGAALIDLRSNSQIKKYSSNYIENVSYNPKTTNGESNNMFGVGFMYSF